MGYTANIIGHHIIAVSVIYPSMQWAQHLTQVASKLHHRADTYGHTNHNIYN